MATRTTTKVSAPMTTVEESVNTLPSDLTEATDENPIGNAPLPTAEEEAAAGVAAVSAAEQRLADEQAAGAEAAKRNAASTPAPLDETIAA
jgi:hypothetical protein